MLGYPFFPQWLYFRFHLSDTVEPRKPYCHCKNASINDDICQTDFAAIGWNQLLKTKDQKPGCSHAKNKVPGNSLFELFTNCIELLVFALCFVHKLNIFKLNNALLSK